MNIIKTKENEKIYADRGIYYYKTYDNYSIVGVDMNREDLNDEALISYKLMTDKALEIQNWQIPVCWEKSKASQRSSWTAHWHWRYEPDVFVAAVPSIPVPLLL